MLTLRDGQTAEIKITNKDGVTTVDVIPGEEPAPPPPPPPDDVLDLRAYGAKGDGVADDTDAVQRACHDSAAGKGTVIGHPDDVYRLNHRGTKPFLNIRSRFCVEVRSNTELEGRGCTFKLGDDEAAYCFTNADQENGTADVVLRGFEIDGNRANQPGRKGPRPPSDRQEIGGIGVYNVERWTIENIQAREIKVYAGRFIHARNCTFRDLTCVGCDGAAWSFGLDTISKGPKECRDGLIENIWAEDCRQNFWNLQGNPVIASAIDCTFRGRIGGSNCAGGTKIQGRSKGSTVEFARFAGGAFKTANSGLKLQGNQNSQQRVDWIQDLVVDKADSNDCAAEGVRYTHAINCRVKHYIGRNCAQLENQPEIRFANHCEDCRADLIESANAEGHVVHCHGDGVLRPSVGKLRSDGCTTDVVANHASGAVLTIDEMECRNTKGRHAAASKGRIEIGLLRADKDISVSGNVTVARFERL